MLCNEFMVEMNRLLDERCRSLNDELRQHTRTCRNCRSAWETLRSCDQTLAQTNRGAGNPSADRVLQRLKRHTREERRRKLAVEVSFAATIAAAMLTMAVALSRPNQQVDTTVTGVAKNNDVTETDITPDWSQWTAAKDLLGRHEFWNLRWSSEGTDASVAASVSSGIRPVAQTMSSAFKVIRQNMLPTARPSDSNDEQAGCLRAVSLV